MADHLRKQIRVAAAAALTGLATTAARVFDSRARAVQMSDLPCLRVYCDEEDIELVDFDGGQQRDLVLIVEALATADATVDDVVDQIAKEVEVALSIDQTLGGLAKTIDPQKIGTEFAGDGESIVAVARMEFAVRYYSQKGAPDVAT